MFFLALKERDNEKIPSPPAFPSAASPSANNHATATAPPSQKNPATPAPVSPSLETSAPVAKPIEPPSSPPPVSLPACTFKEHIVDIYGFKDWRPANLTLLAGDRATFINRDNDLHWPGANPHPTHSSLPLFDALGGISKEQSYSYAFRDPLSVGYHDHLDGNDPPTIGTITILPCK